MRPDVSVPQPDLPWTAIRHLAVVALRANPLVGDLRHVFVPFLGALFIPWTTLMYVLVQPGGVTGWDLLWLGFALAADIASVAGGAVGGRGRVPGYG